MALFDPGEHPTEFPAEVVSDFTVQDILAWARTKPAGEVYDYGDFRNCGICQFLKSTGRCADPAVSVEYWRDREVSRRGPSKYIQFDRRLNRAANCRPYTFGAFADRLEALL